MSQIALLTAAGETRACWDLRFSGVPQETAGLPQCVAVLVDQSRLLLRQDELQQRIDDQTRQLAELHAQAIAAGASHARLTQRLVGELQQPLARVTRFARSLRDAAAVPDDGTLRPQLDGIIESANAMLRIVGELAEAIQAESGQLTPRMSRCDIGYVLREAVHAEQGAAPNGIRLAVDGPSNAVSVLADGAMLDHMLRALLRKATHLADPGSTVRVEWGTREADDQMPARVEFACIRRGARRPPHELARMFSLCNANAGAGDGQARDHLAMLGVRVMVEMHGGRVWASNVADGVAVRLWLPMGQ